LWVRQEVQALSRGADLSPSAPLTASAALLALWPSGPLALSVAMKIADDVSNSFPICPIDKSS
jgi:hypothetical protein